MTERDLDTNLKRFTLTSAPEVADAEHVFRELRKISAVGVSLDVVVRDTARQCPDGHQFLEVVVGASGPAPVRREIASAVPAIPSRSAIGMLRP